MKRKSFLVILLSVFALVACAKGKQPIAFAKLPSSVKKAVLANYTQQQVQFITWDKELGKDEYEFMIEDGTKIEYYENGQLHKVESKQGVMDVFIPEVMLKYINSTFPNSIVTQYKNDGWRQQIEINNSVELIFNRKGKFLRIDD